MFPLVEKEEKEIWGEQIKMIEEIKSKRMWGSPPRMSPSEIHQREEQFSLKTNWKLAEKVPYDQDCKKDPHVIGEEGRKSDQAGIPGRGLRKRDTALFRKVVRARLGP